MILSLLLLSFLSLSAQINFETVFQKSYSDLPFSLRIENSGIYAVSSFDIYENQIALKTYDDSFVYLFLKGKEDFQKINSIYEYDAVINNENIISNGIDQNELPIITKKIFGNNQSQNAIDKNGKLFLNNSLAVSVKISQDKLELFSEFLLDRKKEIQFPNSLAYSSIIGIDKYSNHFILIEEFESHIPLKVKRSILTIDKNSEVKSKLSIPLVKYLSLIKEFQIDEEGNLYHFYSEESSFSIIKIRGLANSNKADLVYPMEFQKEIHFNEFVKTTEYKGINPLEVQALASRLGAVKIGERYVLHKYSVSSKNLAPTNTTASDGDVVRTPPWLVEGINAKVPYKWGGFQSINQFTYGIATGKYAGDINTSGVSAYAVGVDCSGFVSRCWQLTYHSATSMMPNITTQYGDWNSLRPGDAIHKVGHVRLFIERNDDGSFKIVEASARDWGVSYWSYKASDLTTYTPRYYNNMSNDYTFNRPTMVKAEIDISDDIKLTWDADTVDVSHFKIYGSKDGINWLPILEIPKENSSVVFNNSNEYLSFRISSIINDLSSTEGNWSNVLSVYNVNGENKILIVDGFQRSRGTGSWQGPGHIFVDKYAAAIKELNHSVESIKNDAFIDDNFSLEKYSTVFWISGDESTTYETFNSQEQSIVKKYLESGGNLFVSGSEIGWDLSNKGSEDDKLFYTDYLKASYAADDAGVLNAAGIEGSIFDGIFARFGQTYEEDYPDVINPTNGSFLCFSYSNGKGAGISYDGIFGNSDLRAKLIYLSFPIETIANDSVFNSLISKSIDFFDNPVSVESESNIPKKFSLSQNFPNPFNPTTIINYSLPSNEFVNLKVYDILGNELVTLVNESQKAGKHKVNFNAENLPSGVYIYRLKSGSYIDSKKMILVK